MDGRERRLVLLLRAARELMHDPVRHLVLLSLWADAERPLLPRRREAYSDGCAMTFLGAGSRTLKEQLMTNMKEGLR